MTPKFTHNGWFSFAPIKLADVDSDAPLIAPRHWSAAPLLWLAEALQGGAIFVLSFLNPDYEPAWAIRITGERS